MPHDITEPRFGESSYDTTQFGGTDEHLQAFIEKPWRVNYVRVGFTPVPTAIPGESATYNCVLFPTDAIQDHLERWKILRGRVERGGVETWRTPDGAVHYREQHSGPDGAQLVEIAPLHPEHDAAGTPQDPPPGRDTPFRKRYAVVTGGDISATTRPQKVALVSLETTTIATGDEFETREAVRDAREHNGF